jgi:flagellar operon protein
MDNAINNLAPSLIPGSGLKKPVAGSKVTAGSLSFNAVLEANINREQGLKFSAHAQERLASRGIKLQAEDLARIQQGVAKAAEKGSRESLVIKDGLALVVSVTNRTVITAIDMASSKENVFTNIDTAVVV